MTYELALKLKNAGFKYGNYLHRAYKPDGTFRTLGDPDEGEYVYEPTLEELIDACGDELGVIDKGKDDQDKVMWRVYSVDKIPHVTNPIQNTSYFLKSGGSSLVEAIAYFWLALQNK